MRLNAPTFIFIDFFISVNTKLEFILWCQNNLKINSITFTLFDINSMKTKPNICVSQTAWGVGVHNKHLN